ncbi:hypothetical protein [Streptomyces hirsutus]|uniref:hypothetical protein n=1 Tax=Streptomyces hirsutus TaxID=35620 RepID=UPI003698B15B
MSDEQAPASGSVPNAFGNALAWKWTRQMPTTVRRSGLPTLLYALRAMANAGGELRFNGDRKPIRIQDIAKAACCDEKDARRYLEAAIRAGVVTVRGERKRGVPTLYVLLPHPFPDWTAAADYLESTKRDRAGRKPAPWVGEGTEVRGASPEPETEKFGGPPPELTDGTETEVRGTAPRWSSGDRPPIGSGDRPPNNPGVTHVSTHDGAGVGFQPQVVGAPHDQIDHQEPHHDTPPPEPEPDPDDHETWTRCRSCRRPILPDPQRPGRTVHARCETPAVRLERHTA